MRLMEGNPVPHLIAFQVLESFIAKGWTVSIRETSPGQIRVTIEKDLLEVRGIAVLLHEAIDNLTDEWIRFRTASLEDPT